MNKRWCGCSVILSLLACSSSVIVTGQQTPKPPRRYTCNIATLHYDCQLSLIILSRNESILFGIDNKKTKITLQRSHLQYLPASLLNAFRAAELLNVESLGIQEIESNAFANAETLQRLYLSENYLTDIHNDTFEGATALEILVMSTNELRNIDDRAFILLSNLKQLHMDENFIVKLPNFNNNLEYLNVSHNQLQNIGDNHFKNLRKLQIVDASSNILTRFNLKQFNSAWSMTKIDVSNNSLTELYIPYTVKHLYAQRNRIHSIESKQCAVEELSLAENNLVEQPNLASCRSITYLDLTNNQIESFDYLKIAHMSNLDYLKIANNRLFEINLHIFPNQPERTVRLRRLDLSDNHLTHVPVITAFKHMTTLSVRNNYLLAFDFSQMNELKGVLVSNNQWNCESIRSIVHVIRDRDANVAVQEGYSIVNGIRCKECDKVLDGKLHEMIYEVLFHRWSNQQELKKQCSTYTTTTDIHKKRLGIVFDINTEKGKVLQQIEIVQGEYNEIKADNYQEKQYRSLKIKHQQKVHKAIEKHRSSQGVLPEGLVTDQEIFGRTFDYVVDEKFPLNHDILENLTLIAEDTSNQLLNLRFQKNELKNRIAELLGSRNQFRQLEKDCKNHSEQLEKQLKRNAVHL